MKMTTIQREALLTKFLSTKGGLDKLGEAMATPLKRHLDYEGVARKFFAVSPLPGGALPIFDKELTEEEKEELRIANKPW